MPAVKAYKLIGIIIFVFACILVVSVFPPKSSKDETWFQLDPIMLDKIEYKYGWAAKQRFVAWQKLMDTAKTIPERDQLQQVNDFFNRNIEFSNDLVLWLKNDYWATPIELLAKGAGDCEDFSIAKYFTLIEIGVDENKLRITYVTVLNLNIPHMVLTYFELPRSIPLVLDNLKSDISLATDRNDLLPIYSFNGSGLWLDKIKNNGLSVGNADRLNKWADLKQRMMGKLR